MNCTSKVRYLAWFIVAFLLLSVLEACVSGSEFTSADIDDQKGKSNNAGPESESTMEDDGNTFSEDSLSGVPPKRAPGYLDPREQVRVALEFINAFFNQDCQTLLATITPKSREVGLSMSRSEAEGALCPYPYAIDYRINSVTLKRSLGPVPGDWNVWLHGEFIYEFDDARIVDKRYTLQVEEVDGEYYILNFDDLIKGPLGIRSNQGKQERVALEFINAFFNQDCQALVATITPEDRFQWEAEGTLCPYTYIIDYRIDEVTLSRKATGKWSVGLKGEFIFAFDDVRIVDDTLRLIVEEVDGEYYILNLSSPSDKVRYYRPISRVALEFVKALFNQDCRALLATITPEDRSQWEAEGILCPYPYVGFFSDYRIDEMALKGTLARSGWEKTRLKVELHGEFIYEFDDARWADDYFELIVGEVDGEFYISSLGPDNPWHLGS